MKIGTWLRVCGLAVAVGGAFMAGAWARAQSEQPILKWPLSQEAVHAAANNHRVLFENDTVRLLEVTVQPGQTEPLHWHMYPSVFAINGVQAPHQVSDIDSFPAHFYRLECKKMDGKSIETDWAKYKR